MELEISPPTLLAFSQDTVEDAEQLQDTLLTSRASSSGELNSERVHASVVATNPEATMANTNTANQLHIREEALNAYKVGVLIAMLQILPGHFNIVELEEAELAELMRVLFERDCELPAIKPLLKAISPSAQLLDVLVHRRLVGDEVFLECLAVRVRLGEIARDFKTGKV